MRRGNGRWRKKALYLFRLKAREQALYPYPVNILHGLVPGVLGHDLGLPHCCPSWLGRGWASPSIAHVLGLAHLPAWASPIGHAHAAAWACPSRRIITCACTDKKTVSVGGALEHGQAQANTWACPSTKSLSAHALTADLTNPTPPAAMLLRVQLSGRWVDLPALLPRPFLAPMLYAASNVGIVCVRVNTYRK